MPLVAMTCSSRSIGVRVLRPKVMDRSEEYALFMHKHLLDCSGD